MAASSNQREISQRFVIAHGTIAALALIAASGLQASWLETSSSRGDYTHWLYRAMTIISATAWLVSTAWLHFKSMQGITSSVALLQAGGDLVLAAVAGLLLAAQNRSALALAGLWVVPPILIAISGTSAAALAMVAIAASNQQPEGKASFSRWRIAIALAVVVSLGMLAIASSTP
jgi:NaMN:DMB phosphoribosyltransferase